MKPVTQSCLIVWCFLLSICYGSAPRKFIHSRPYSHDWKKLYFVYHWPVTVCKMSENDCDSPPMYWTIHGLWTDKADDCNKTWHFNVTEIKDLLVDMRQYWPDVLHTNRTKFWYGGEVLSMHENIPVTQSMFSDNYWKIQKIFQVEYLDFRKAFDKFFLELLNHRNMLFKTSAALLTGKHEWDKHGTCAATLESLNSQKKYFSKALELYEKLDLNSYLLKLGIKPGSTYYQLGAIKEALISVYNVTPKIQCLSPEQDEEVQTIGQIKFCFTKDFTLRNCTESKVDSYSAHENMLSRTEDLSICNDTLTNYPSHVQPYK